MCIYDDGNDVFQVKNLIFVTQNLGFGRQMEAGVTRRALGRAHVGP